MWELLPEHDPKSEHHRGYRHATALNIATWVVQQHAPHAAQSVRVAWNGAQFFVQWRDNGTRELWTLADARALGWEGEDVA